jgi:hypothetical protein
LRALLFSLIAVAFVIGAALVALPALVDAGAVRAIVLRELESAIGRPLTIAGTSELDLLPQPRLSLTDVTLPPATADRPAMSADRVDLWLRLVPLLRGEIEVMGARIVRPVAALAGPTAVGERLVGLDRLRQAKLQGPLTVVDGRLEVGPSPATRPLELYNLDIEMGMDAATGAASIVARGRHMELPLRVELDVVGSADGASVDLDLAVGTAGERTELALNGYLQPSDQNATFKGKAKIAADGDALAAQAQAILAPDVARHLTLPTGALQLTGDLSWGQHGFALTPGKLTLAAGELDVALSADLAQGAVQLGLNGSRLDLAHPPPLGLFEALLWPQPPTGLAGRLDLRLEALGLGGQDLRDLRVDAGLAPDGTIELRRASAVLPGRGEIVLAGRYERGEGSPSWTGKLQALAPELRPILAWAGVDLSALGNDAFKSLLLEGEVRATPGRVELHEADISLDASRGTASVILAGGDIPVVAVEASFDRLDLPTYLATGGGQGLRRALEQALEAPPHAGIGIAVALDVDRLSLPQGYADGVRLAAELAAGTLELKQLSMKDLAGARVVGVGSLDARSDRFAAAVDVTASDPLRLARLFGVDPPALLVALGATRGTATIAGDTDEAKLDIAVDTENGAFGLEGSILRPLEPAGLDLLVSTRAPDARAFLRGFGGVGFDQPALDGALDARVGLKREDPGGPLRIDLELGLGGTKLAGDLTLRRADVEPQLEGAFEARRLDPRTLEDAYRLLEPVVGLLPGPFRSWPGDWPTRPLRLPASDKSKLDLAVEAELVGPDGGNRDARARLEVGGRKLALRDMDLPLAGGRLTGTLEVSDVEGGPQATLDLAVAGADAAPLLRALRAGRGLSGTLDLDLEASSLGSSLADMMRNLGGKGHLRLRNGRIEGLALSVAGRLETGPTGSLPYSDAEGSFELRRGIARTTPGPITIETDGRRITAEGWLDLAAWLAGLTLEVEGASSPPPGEAQGPLDAVELLARNAPPEAAVQNPLSGP